MGSAAPPVSAWKSQHGGIEASDAKRLKAVEEENGKLKRLLADPRLYREEGLSVRRRHGRRRATTGIL